MKITIEKVENGYIVKTNEGSSVCIKITDVLYDILEEFGELGSRHDAKRIYIIERPGDKHPDFTKADAKVIWGNND